MKKRFFVITATALIFTMGMLGGCKKMDSRMDSGNGTEGGGASENGSVSDDSNSGGKNSGGRNSDGKNSGSSDSDNNDSGSGGSGSDGSENSGSGSSGSGSSASGSAAPDFAKDSSDMFTSRDYEVGFDESSSVSIQFQGDSVSASSDSVRISGTTVTITQEASYILSGTLDDGMVIVDAPDTAKIQLVLNGVNINSETSAPFYILEADKVFVTLAEDTENTLSNGGTFTAVDKNNIDAAVFSKQDVTFNGSGSLTVKSPAGHGIVSKDDLIMTSGSYAIQAASHGLDANDSVRIANARITAKAGKDGIHAENSKDESLGFVYILSGTLDVEAGGDGVSAGSYVQVEGGDFHIVSGGGSSNVQKKTPDPQGGGRKGQFLSTALSPSSSSSSSSADSADESSTSAKGLKAASGMLISKGSFTIDSADDAVHSNASITVNGGTFEIATGDDGFHADETLTVEAGKINITESYEGLEALDLIINGGDISLTADDDGLNAAGGADSSGMGGMHGKDKFGGHGGMGRGGMAGGAGDDGFGGADGRGAADGGFDGAGGRGAPNGGMGGGSSASDGSIVISGGTIYVKASGDGIDSNGTLAISGGYITVCGPAQGDTATLDYDMSGVITGGTFIGSGASGMAQSFSDSKQGVIAVNVGNQPAGTAVTLKDHSDGTVVSYEPELPFAVVIISSPEIEKGESYTVTAGSSSGEFEAE